MTDFWSFTLGDLIVGTGVLSSILFYVISYRRKYSGPTREEFRALKKEYEEHVVKEEAKFDSIIDKLTTVQMEQAVVAEAMRNMKERVSDGIDEIKEEIKSLRATNNKYR